RNDGFLRLQSVERATLLRAAEKGGASIGSVWIGIVTLAVVSGAAVRAVTAADRGGNYDTVAGRQIADFSAYVLHNPDAFMPENGPRFHARQSATNHVQVSSANGTRSNPDDCIEIIFNNWIFDFLQTDIANVMKHDRLHRTS